MAVNGIVHSPAGVVPLSRSGTPLINHLCPRCAPSIYCIARAVLGSQSHDNAMPCDCASYAAAGEEKIRPCAQKEENDVLESGPACDVACEVRPKYLVHEAAKSKMCQRGMSRRCGVGDRQSRRMGIPAV